MAGSAVAPSREQPWGAATPSVAAAVEGCGGTGARRELRGWGGWGCFSSEM